VVLFEVDVKSTALLLATFRQPTLGGQVTLVLVGDGVTQDACALAPRAFRISKPSTRPHSTEIFPDIRLLNWIKRLILQFPAIEKLVQ
jgi:hypothetical protein